MAKLMYDARFSWFNMLLVSVIAVKTVKAQYSCTTPREESGICVPYNKCTFVTSLLYERYHYTLVWDSTQVTLNREIRARRCPQFKNDVYLCCELHYVENGTETKLQSDDDMNLVGLNILRSIDCGFSPLSDRILNGINEKADLEEFPSMALLEYDPRKRFYCAGSLITERYVLTAAHCVTGKGNRVIGVRLGEYDISTEIDCQTKDGSEMYCTLPVQNFGIEKIITHESYEGIKNDIALIRLNRNVECRSNIKPVCLPLPSQNGELQENQEYFVAGWGLTKTGIISNILLKEVIPHKPIETCRNVFWHVATDISDIHICAGARNHMQNCRGDSGGPLFSKVINNNTPRTVQLGVLSAGVPECSPQKSYPTLYTKVEAFLPWITNKLAEYERIESLKCSKKV